MSDELTTKNPRFLGLANGIGSFGAEERFLSVVLFLLGKLVFQSFKGGIGLVIAGYAIVTFYKFRTSGGSILRRLTKPRFLHWAGKIRTENEEIE